MIRSMEGFTFASALDLNMSYYQIKLDADSQELCTIVFPWGKYKYKYKRLPMGIKSCLSLSKTWNTLRQPYNLDDLLLLRNSGFTTYLVELLILTNNSFNDHLLKLEMILANNVSQPLV
jgi:hypothetical protein